MVYVPAQYRRYVYLPVTGLCVGVFLGFVRGARRASWRFLAENAHRTPRTMRGWYLYKKTKNYRVLLGGATEGGRDGMKLCVAGLVWAGVEDGVERLGEEGERRGYGTGQAGRAKEVGAGLVTAGLFALLCKQRDWHWH